METAKIVIVVPRFPPETAFGHLLKCGLSGTIPKMEAMGQTRTVAFFGEGGVSSDSDAHSRWRMSCSAGGRQQAFSFLKNKQRKNNVSVLLHTIRAW